MQKRNEDKHFLLFINISKKIYFFHFISKKIRKIAV